MKFGAQAKWFNGIDSLRFVLAFVVVLSHSDVIYTTVLKHSSYLILRWSGYFLANAFDGTSAVIAFFIISGFVIHYPNKSGPLNLKAFWIRRLVRVVIPMLFIILLGSYFNHPEKTVLWSLFSELSYYCLYPFLSMIRLSWKIKLILSYVAVALIVFLLSFHYLDKGFHFLGKNHQGFFYIFKIFLLATYFFPCWLAGVLLADQIDSAKKVTYNSVIIYRLLVFTASWFCSVGRFHLHVGYIVSMNIFALLLYKWIQAEVIYFKENPPNLILEKLGKFSYSLYLCHHTIYVIWGIFIYINPYTYPFYILSTILISYGFYLAIERPSHLLAQKISSKFNYYPV